MSSDGVGCTYCAERGRACEKRFHPDREWENNRKFQNKKLSEIEKNEDKLSKLLEQQDELQEKIKAAAAKSKRLRLELKQSERHRSNMLIHDSRLMDQLDVEDPPSLIPSELGPTLESPSLTFHLQQESLGTVAQTNSFSHDTAS